MKVTYMRIATFSLVTILIIFLALGVLYFFAPKPEIKKYIPYSTAFFDRNGELLRLNLASDDRYRLYQTLDNISPTLINATILYEDKNYYQHAGIDISALFRAAWDTYIKKSRRVGASTISMQVARLYWRIPSNTISGKLEQIIRAIQLSRHYSKDEILELYLNLAPYGRNIEGITAASLIYFNKKPIELNISEALTLAVIPQNPNKRNPTAERNLTELRNARTRLFKRWIEQHPEDKKLSSLVDLPLAVRSPEQLPFKAPHFVNYVTSQQSQWKSGYIDTTLDINIQQNLETLVKNYVSSKASKGINNASALLLNYETMSIEAMVGSADFHNKKILGQVNGATAKRSPGSTLKPFVYALALDEGIIHPNSLLKDSPRRYGGFTPENYEKNFLGPISAKDALIQSRNVPAVDLQAQLKNQSFYDFLKQVDISKLKNESHYGLALALGGGEVSMLELASLYSILANQGTLKPISTQAKHNNDSNSQISKQLLSKEASYLVLDILKDNPAPNNNVQLEQINQGSFTKQHIAWKTGTSWSFRDAWSVGISGPYVLVVWVGNFNGDNNPAFIGRTAAGPLFFSIFNYLNANNLDPWLVSDTTELEQLNLKKVEVCSQTGDLYQSYCEGKKETWFIPGVSPIKVSTIHRKIPINIKTGLRSCSHKHGETILEVYEFWPSDFLKIFRQAGISLKSPPKFETQCSLNSLSLTGEKPVITSPQNTVEYYIRFDSSQDQSIPFTAITDPDVKKLHWFVNQAYIDSTEANETLLWKAKPGEHIVKAIDDSGRANSIKIKVKQTQ